MSKNVVVIVGAGPGVSAAVASEFVAKGHPLVLIARNEANLQGLAGKLEAQGGSVEIMVADAAVPAEVANAIATINQPIAALVYNAAGWGGPLLEAADAELRSATEVNLYSIITSTKAALPGLKEANGVVLITGGGYAMYPSSEAGILSVGKAMTRSAAFLLAEELKPQGVRVHTVTIAGTVDPATNFAPSNIAQTYLQLFENVDSPIEVVFQG